MEELGLEDVPVRSLVVVQRRPDGGWQHLGSINMLVGQAQQQQWQAPAAAVPAVPGGQVIDLTVSPAQQGAAPPAPAAPPRKLIDLTGPQQPAAAPGAAAAAAQPNPQPMAEWLGGFQPLRPEPQHPRLAAPPPAVQPLPPPGLVHAMHPQRAAMPAAPAAPPHPIPAVPAAVPPQLPPAVPAVPPQPAPPAAALALHPPALPHRPALGAQQQPVQQQHHQRQVAQPPAPAHRPAVLPPPGGPAALRQQAHGRLFERVPWQEVRPAQHPAPPPPVAAPARSPANMAAPALLAQARGSSTRRRSLLACPACKSVRRGASAAEAA